MTLVLAKKKIVLKFVCYLVSMYDVVKLVQLVSTDVKHVIHIFVTCATNAMMMIMMMITVVFLW